MAPGCKPSLCPIILLGPRTHQSSVSSWYFLASSSWMEIGPVKVSGWVGSWMGGHGQNCTCSFSIPVSFFLPLQLSSGRCCASWGFALGMIGLCRHLLSVLSFGKRGWSQDCINLVVWWGGGVLDWIQGSDLGGWGNGPELCSMSLTLGFLWSFHLMLEASFPCGKCFCPYLGSAVAPVIFIYVCSYVCMYLFYHSLLSGYIIHFLEMWRSSLLMSLWSRSKSVWCCCVLCILPAFKMSDKTMVHVPVLVHVI